MSDRHLDLDLDLDHLDALDAAATPGKWIAGYTQQGGDRSTRYWTIYQGFWQDGELVCGALYKDADAALIVEYRAAVPALVRELRAFREAQANVFACVKPGSTEEATLRALTAILPPLGSEAVYDTARRLGVTTRVEVDAKAVEPLASAIRAIASSNEECAKAVTALASSLRTAPAPAPLISIDSGGGARVGATKEGET